MWRRAGEEGGSEGERREKCGGRQGKRGEVRERGGSS